MAAKENKQIKPRCEATQRWLHPRFLKLHELRSVRAAREQS